MIAHNTHGRLQWLPNFRDLWGAHRGIYFCVGLRSQCVVYIDGKIVDTKIDGADAHETAMIAMNLAKRMVDGRLDGF